MNANLVKLLDKYNMQSPSSGTCEPGYDDKSVIKADQNDIPQKIYDALEFMGFSCEWEDEWIECDNCYKSFRTSPDSYSWQMYGAIFDGFALCGDCMDWDELLESYENHPRKALTTSLFHGHEAEVTDRYTLIQDEFENGFYPSQNDDPQKILSKLLENDPQGKYIFVMTDQGQFGIEFAVYKKTSTEEE